MEYVTRLLALMVVAIAASTGSHAQSIGFVQVKSKAPVSASTLTATFSSPQAAGNLNIVAIGWSDTTTTVTSVSDSKGNNYQLAATHASPSLGMSQSIYYASNIVAASAGTNTVTVALSANVSYPDLRIVEYSGVSTLDKTSSGAGASTTANSGAVSTTAANELLFATNYTFGYTNGPGSGYTSRAITNNGGIVEDRVVSSTGTYNATASVTADNWIMQLVTFAAGAPSATSFYVSPTGNNANDGSIAQPWRTITYAISQVDSGSTIVARGGVYNERVAIDKALTLHSHPGELAIVDGTGVPVVSGGYAYGLVDIASGISNVTVSGLEIRNYIATSASVVPAGIHMEGTGSNIHILNNHIHHIQNKASYAGPRDGSCSGATPNAFGLIVAGTSGTTPIEAFTIAGNELDNLITGCSESLAINGNAQDFVIENNVVHDNSNIGIAALGGEGVAPAHDYASNGTIRGNQVYNIYTGSQVGNPWDVYGPDCECADGIYLDGSDSIVVERNRVHHVDWGIETTGENAGQNTTNITVRNNLFYANRSAGMGIGGQGNPGGAANITVVNNTFHNNDTSSAGNGTLSLGGSISGYVIFKNNIVQTSSSGQTITGQTSTPGLSFDYNLYFGGTSPFSEAHSLSANPQLVNPAATPANLDTQSGSPARAAGVDLGATVVGTMDYAGAARVQGNIDIGAYEH